MSGFPEDEAATLQQFQQRQSEAPDLFLGAYIPDTTDSSTRKLIGYVCSTLASGNSLTHESMSRHDSSGESVCIHAVCVAKEHQRKGIAVALLKEYISRLEKDPRYQRALLITHDDLRDLYEKAGFEWVGKSAVVHGSKPWNEMRRILKDVGLEPVTTQSLSSLPPGLWEALQSSSRRSRPTSRLLSSFASIGDVIEVDDSGKVNRYDLLCPREGCGSVILKSGVGTLERKESVEVCSFLRRCTHD